MRSFASYTIGLVDTESLSFRQTHIVLCPYWKNITPDMKTNYQVFNSLSASNHINYLSTKLLKWWKMSNFRMFVSLLFNFLVLVQNNANIVSLYFFIQVNGKQGCAYNFDTQHVVWPWINEKYFFYGSGRFRSLE